MAANGDGIFTTLHPAFAAFLRRMGADRDPDKPWIAARNFLLDEGVLEPRAAIYGKKGADGFAEIEDWVDAHGEYLDDHVFLKPSTKPQGILDPARTETCPETFRHPESFSTYGAAHKNLDLLRVLDAESMGRISGRPADRIAAAAREVVRARAAGEEPARLLRSEILGVLQAWNSKCDVSTR